MTAPAPKKDAITFQYAELRRGNAPARALAIVALEFIHGYSTSKHYDELLDAMTAKLAESADALGEAAWRNLVASLSDRQHALLDEKRSRERRPKKWEPSKPVKDIINDSSDDDNDGANAGLTAEELDALRVQREADDKAKEEEWRRIQARMDDLERQKAENEAKLASRARQVDTKAFEEKLKQDGVVLLNAGKGSMGAAKKGGKGGGGKEVPLSAEEVGAMHQEVAQVMRERDSLRTILATSEEELPAKVAEAAAGLTKVEAEAAALGGAAMENKKAKEMAKGQVTQLQQKLAKQTMERNRLAMQLKAMEPSAQRDKLVTLFAQIDKIAVQIELAHE